MQKIKSLFQRNYEGDHLVRDEIVPGAEWVVNGEGISTEKFDGTCCMIKEGKLFKRYDAKNGKKPPQGFMPAQEPDLVTGHWPGWLEVDSNNPDDKWHLEAFSRSTRWENGTYELVGPKVQGNKYNLQFHELFPHGGGDAMKNAPRTFDGLKEWLKDKNIEGVVWHHPDGRMVKIKKKDFGLKW